MNTVNCKKYSLEFLFNIFLCDLFFPANSIDIASYVDGTTS